MNQKKRILLKISGEILLSADKTKPCTQKLSSVIAQIKKLKNSHQFGIVIGGGNFFRGSQHGKHLGLTPTTAHSIGMLATTMNSLIIHDLCSQHQVDSTILSAFFSPQISSTINSETIGAALRAEQLIIFAGGTGNPFFTTDTSAVLRALQMGATQVWKGTNVDGVYNADPKTNPRAQFIKNVSFKEAIENRYKVMDLTAYTMAQEYSMPLRVFDIAQEKILIALAEGQDVGSIIS